jgi:outer membrane protein TolC
VQSLPAGNEAIGALRWPVIGSGVPSELLSRRPDIAAAEARLAAASADVQVARAAMLPRLVLGADLGSGSRTLPTFSTAPTTPSPPALPRPSSTMAACAPSELASAEQQELLEAYRSSILAGFSDVEKALNAISGVERQRQWQDQEVQQARIAFDLAQQRYAAGAETLLSVLETQRTLYLAQDEQAQLYLARLQGSVALYKALGGVAGAAGVGRGSAMTRPL